MRYIQELREGESVIEHYFCKSKQTLKSRAGKSYLSLKLQDKTGMVDAKVWDLNHDIKSFEENQFIKIDGTVLIYQNEKQINIKRIRRSLEGEYDPADYVPQSEKNVPEMLQAYLDYINTIENPFVKKLLESILIENQEIAAHLSTHSAAKNIHHGYMGGLLEHSLSVTQICDFMSQRYKHVNRDILIASAMLHDIGKIKELSTFPLNDYTDDGQLLGHIMIGYEIVCRAADAIEGFPPQLKSLLGHCILSHHGEYEYGSPQLPKTIEALILHCADNMDAKVKAIEEFIDTDNTAGPWAGYQKMLQRNIRKSEF